MSRLWPRYAQSVSRGSLPVTLERDEPQSLIRLEGEFTVTSAAELKSLLLENLACGTDLRLDLERVTEIDITFLQLLWAAKIEADRINCKLEIRVPETVRNALSSAGFEQAF